MRASVCIVFAVAVFFGGHAGAALAENLHLTRAEAALEELDYTVAREELTRALKLGAAAPTELARIYLLSGIVSGAFGESRAAREQFERALALRPHARLPTGYAPKIAEPFDQARERGTKLVFRCSDGVLDVADDPLEMVDAIDASDVSTVAVDAYGNQLSAPCPKLVRAVTPRRLPPPHRRKSAAPGEDVIGPFPASPDDGDDLRRNVVARWQTWGGLALASGVVGSYYANDTAAGGADNGRYQRYAFGAAGACAAVAVVLALDEHRDHKRARRRAQAVLAPTRGGGALWVSVRF